MMGIPSGPAFCAAGCCPDRISGSVTDAESVPNGATMRLTDPEFRKAVLFVSQKLQPIDIPWAFTGSLGMALQGMELSIADIDIQTQPSGSV